MKIIVTGATGNLGTSTIQALSQDARVSQIVGVARRKPDLQLNKCSFVTADITTADLAGLFDGADVVIHLAWLIQPLRDIKQLQRVNVDGAERVLRAVREARVPSLIVASSVGAYSPGSKETAVNEDWPTEGIPSALYSRQKVQVERMLDEFESQNPDIRVLRLRPALVFKSQAAAEIHRLFLGPWVPNFLLHPRRIPFVPDMPRLQIQCIHSLDAGRAFALAALSDARGAINLAADPVLSPQRLSEVLRARRISLPARVLRLGVQAAWHLRLLPIDKGWFDIALGVPIMDTSRSRERLGFQPRFTATEALLELLAGMYEGSGTATIPLQPDWHSEPEKSGVGR